MLRYVWHRFASSSPLRRAVKTTKHIRKRNRLCIYYDAFRLSSITDSRVYTVDRDA